MDKGSQITALKNGLFALCELQPNNDANTWQISKPLLAKFRHIGLHLAKVSGRLCGQIEKWDHAAYKDPNAGDDFALLERQVLEDGIADLYPEDLLRYAVLGWEGHVDEAEFRLSYTGMALQIIPED